MNQVTTAETRMPGPLMGRFIGFADRLALWGGYVAITCLVIMAGLMLAQVVVAFLSKIFPSVRGDISVAWEYGAYLMGTMFLMASAITLRAGRHIRLGVVIQNCSPRVLRMLEIFCSLIALLFTVYLTWALALGAERAWNMNTTSIESKTPIWIPLAVFSLGTALLALQFAIRLVSAIFGFELINTALKAGGEIEE
ncbi:MAG: TRAP transporter small permease subunit [Pseudorhodobacter sp.]